MEQNVYTSNKNKITAFLSSGQPNWGDVAWYLNNSLIPEIVVKRGKTYTFIIEGGADPKDTSNYHPFYITSSKSGGRLMNTLQEQKVGEIEFLK